ncbi:metallophosphoesterase family protein [Anoxybacteroides tepidamans]|uniref:metallophosphoesterase family protein n=1 Tax=Anoxybacteroides tepidamans TaxID=265948 RepID=UPI0004893A6F|nr:metallophosphoesterase [Anoxybacillus tepidamans]
MKVLIVSDSHGLTKELMEIKKRHAHEVDALIHCGDSELPSGCVELASFLYVRGNCDVDSSFPKERIEDISGVRFFITHGHLYNVKMTLMNLYYRAQEVGAKVVCFGHSHLALAEMIDGILFINPGSILLPRLRKEKTYALLHIDSGQATVQFYDISGQEVTDLAKSFTF